MKSKLRIFTLIIFIFLLSSCSGENKHVHQYSSSWMFDENCHWHECIAPGSCDKKKDNIISHNFDDGIVILKPTDNKNGKKEYTCKECGYKKSDSISFLNAYTDFSTIVSDKVTEQEWINAFNFDNVTIRFNHNCNNIIKIDSSKIFLTKYSDIYNDLYIKKSKDNNFHILRDKQNKKEYSIIKNDDIVNKGSQWISSIHSCFKLFKEVQKLYSSFVYDEKNKSYINKDVPTRNLYKLSTIKFKDGKITSIHLMYSKIYVSETIDFYDYNNTTVNFDVSSLTPHYHDFEHLGECKFECKQCHKIIGKDHEYKLINRIEPSMDNYGEETFECINCKYIAKERLFYEYKEDTDFESIFGDSKMYVWLFPSCTIKFHDVDKNIDTIVKCERGNSISYNGKEETLFRDADYILYDGISIKKYKFDPNFDKRYIERLYVFSDSSLIRDYCIFNPITTSFELKPNVNCTRDFFLSHKNVTFTKLSFKVIGRYIRYMDCEFIDGVTKEKKHYILKGYDYDKTIVDFPIHYHNYKEFYTSNGNFYNHVYHKCCNNDNYCYEPKTYDIHSLECIKLINPTSKMEGEAHYKCRHCKFEFKEILRKTLSSDTDFDNLVSDRKYLRQNIHPIKTAKFKIVDVNNNITKNIKYSYSIENGKHIIRYEIGNEIFEKSTNDLETLHWYENFKYTNGKDTITFTLYDIGFIEFKEIFDKISDFDDILDNHMLSESYYDETKKCFIHNNASSIISSYDIESLEYKIYDDNLCYADVTFNKNNIKNHYKIYVYDVVRKSYINFDTNNVIE